jgi:hypothetical protein
VFIKKDPRGIAALTDLRDAGFRKTFPEGMVSGKVARPFSNRYRARPPPAATLHHRFHQERAGGLPGDVGEGLKQVGLEQNGFAAEAVRKTCMTQQQLHGGRQGLMNFFYADKGHAVLMAGARREHPRAGCFLLTIARRYNNKKLFP